MSGGGAGAADGTAGATGATVAESVEFCGLRLAHRVISRPAALPLLEGHEDWDGLDPDPALRRQLPG